MKEKDAVGTSYRLGQLWRRATLAQSTANEAAEVRLGSHRPDRQTDGFSGIQTRIAAWDETAVTGDTHTQTVAKGLRGNAGARR